MVKLSVIEYSTEVKKEEIKIKILKEVKKIPPQNIHSNKKRKRKKRDRERKKKKR